jgi:hypothetical protein
MEGSMTTEDKRLRTLAGAHVVIGLLAGIFALVKLPLPMRLDTILIVPLIASSLSQAFLLALWGVASTIPLWKKIVGLVIGMVYLETMLVMAVDDSLLDVATVTVTVAIAFLVVLRMTGVKLIRQLPIDSFVLADAEPLRFSIRGLMLMIAAVALLSAVAKALQAIPFPEKHLLGNIMFSLSFVAVAFVALWAVLVKAQPFGRGFLAVVLSPILGLFFAIASNADPAGWVFIILTLIICSATMLVSFLVLRSCGYCFVVERAVGTTTVGRSAGECPD